MKSLICLLALSSLTYASDLESALKQAGNNKAELEKAIQLAPEDQKKGLKFLISHMPKRDLTSLKSDFLLKNLKLAYQTKTTYPWAKKLSDEVFFNDVLPYASLNERRDDWREDFSKRFSKYVKEAKTADEAVKAITAAIAKELNVKYSTKRKKPDQSPYESMEQGLASCTGLSILLVDACRSVGIPARIAGTPQWTTKRGNHNWIEVYTPSDNKWHATEYYPDAKGLDAGWFIGDAAMSNPKSIYHSIYASSWKKTTQHFPLVWDLNIKYVPAINVSQRYIKLGGKDKADAVKCELRIAVLNKKGERTKTPVSILQGTDKVGSGFSPMITDDMNRYLTVQAKKGQIYHAVWIDPDTKQKRQQQITTPKDKDWFTVNLQAK